MHRIKKKVSVGFTLIEMLLVLVILSVLIMAGFNYFQQKTLQNKIDKSALDMQQILTAALTFYAAKGSWPNADSGTSDDIIRCLKGTGSFGTPVINCDLPLLPNVTPGPLSPWRTIKGDVAPYQVVVGTNKDPKFYVYIGISARANKMSDVAAKMIAGKIPLGYISAKEPPLPPETCTTDSGCAPIASVMPPGQSLINAGNLNYAGTYYHGGCIPVPVCPRNAAGDVLTPQVFVVPVSLAGYYDTENTNYPITSFTAYAVGDGKSENPAACDIVVTTGNDDCKDKEPNVNHWRACVDIKTPYGSPTNASLWSNKVRVAAFTRCQPTNEKTGGGLSVYE